MNPSNLDLDIPIWSLEEGIEFCRAAEKLLPSLAHVALGGGVLWRGSSNNDLDVVIYPHAAPDPEFTPKRIRELLGTLLDPSPWMPCDHEEYDDSKTVIKGSHNGKPIDFFFLQ